MSFKATHVRITCPQCGRKFLKAVEDTGDLCDECCGLRDGDGEKYQGATPHGEQYPAPVRKPNA